MKFIWNPSYSVGVKKFDEQHQHFFEITNNIYDLVRADTTDHDQLFAQIMELVNYAGYHLSSEEEAFEKYNYPDADSHLEAHTIYREKIQEYVQQISAPDADLPTIATLIADFASDWLLQHIKTVDKLYTEFLSGIEIQ